MQTIWQRISHGLHGYSELMHLEKEAIKFWLYRILHKYTEKFVDDINNVKTLIERCTLHSANLD